MAEKKGQRTDADIYKDLQKLGVLVEAKRENALNYLINNEQEDDFFHRLRAQERPSGVQ